MFAGCQGRKEGRGLGPLHVKGSASFFRLMVSCFGGASLVAQVVKRLPAIRETRVRSLGWEDLLAKEMATHSTIPAWRIPGTEELGRLQSMVSQRVGHDWATSLHFLSPGEQVKRQMTVSYSLTFWFSRTGRGLRNLHFKKQLISHILRKTASGDGKSWRQGVEQCLRSSSARRRLLGSFALICLSWLACSHVRIRGSWRVVLKWPLLSVAVHVWPSCGSSDSYFILPSRQLM